MFYQFLDYFYHHPAQFACAVVLLLIVGAVWLVREKREMENSDTARQQDRRASRSIWKD